MMLAERTAKPVYIHATAVAIDGFGLLIRGPSRAGKSSVALALLAEAARASRFGVLIGDDRVSIENADGALVLRGHPAISGKIEHRGTGILDVPWRADAIATYVIDLCPANGSDTILTQSVIAIENVLLPHIVLPLGTDALSRAQKIIGLIWKSRVIAS